MFVLHDFDRTGLTICENLRAGTWRHHYRNEFPVIEIASGSTRWRGWRASRSHENNYESVGDDRLRECGATEAEIQFLDERRVELNALITEQLVDLVEAALDERGIAKIVPNRRGPRRRVALGHGPRRGRRRRRRGQCRDRALARRKPARRPRRPDPRDARE